MNDIELKAEKGALCVIHHKTKNIFRVSTLTNLNKTFEFSKAIKESLKWLKENHPELLL